MALPPETDDRTPPTATQLNGAVWQRIGSIFATAAGAALAIAALPLERAAAGIFLVISALGMVSLALPWQIRWLHRTMTVTMAALLGAVGTILWIGQPAVMGKPDPSPPASVISVSSPAPATSGPVPSGPAGKRGNGDEASIQVGQCTRNIGDEDNPVLQISECGAGTMRVVARIEQAITEDAQADALCGQAAPNHTDWHYTNWDQRPDYVDIVFCMQPG